jgi:hypothetical protein
MDIPKLKHVKGHWYLIDTSVPHSEGGIAIWCDVKPIFTSFIDEKEGICSASERCFDSMTVGFPNLEPVVASTNLNDATPMLDVSKFEGLGIVDKSIHYPVDYTMTFDNGKQEPYLIDGFVNILRVKKESK